MNIGNKIEQARKRKGWSQEKLAEKSNVNLRTIQRIEAAHNEPRGSTLHLITTALGLQVEELFEEYGAEENRGYLASLHLLGMLGFALPFGSIIIPYFLWQNKKGKVLHLSQHAKEAILFQCFFIFFLLLLLILLILNSNPIDLPENFISHLKKFLRFILVLTYVLYPSICIIASILAFRGKQRSLYPLTGFFISRKKL